MTTRIPSAALCLALAACGGEPPVNADALPALGAAPGVTVSGISAGAYMAMQYHVAHSGEVDGAGLVAGGPWGCARGDIQRALGPCIAGEGLEVADLVAAAAALAESGGIDRLEQLDGDRVWLFHGTLDDVVADTVTTAAADWYRAAAPGVALEFVDDVPATHGWPTETRGAPCDRMQAPFINACDYDAAGRLLEHLYGPLEPPAAEPAAAGRFDQSTFAATGMADEGLLFVPPRCRERAGCRVHVFFHGCNQAIGQVGEAVAGDAGFRRWAEANDLIVLYPQAEASRVSPMNPLACWDWWGYSGDDYLEREGAQLAAVRAMVERLQAEPRR